MNSKKPRTRDQEQVPTGDQEQIPAGDQEQIATGETVPFTILQDDVFFS